MSETMFDEVRARRLAPEEARAVLLAVARGHSTKLDLHAAYDRQDPRPGLVSG